MRIVVLSLERWDDVWRRNQHLLHEMLRAQPDLEVLFVEPAQDPVHAVRRRRRPRLGRGHRSIVGYDGRLTAYEPTKVIPRSLAWGRRALDVSVTRAMNRRHAPVDLLWVNDPQYGQLARRTPAPVLYDITDDWVLASRGDREHARIMNDDASLLRHSDAVVVCSPALERSKGAIRPVTLVPNAVDLAAYEQPGPRPADLPSTPVVLYVGTLHEDRLDVELALRTGDALAQSGARLVLIGPNALSRRSSERLQVHRHIDVLGPRAHEEIPGYLVHADVLVVPHVVSPFTESLDPIKVYEYLASRRPIVSTPVAGFREHEIVNVADRREFAGSVLRELARNTSEPQPAPQVPSWGDRASVMWAVLRAVHTTTASTSSDDALPHQKGDLP